MSHVNLQEPLDKLGNLCVHYDLDPNEVQVFVDWIARTNATPEAASQMAKALAFYLIANGYMPSDEYGNPSVMSFSEVDAVPLPLSPVGQTQTAAVIDEFASFGEDEVEDEVEDEEESEEEDDLPAPPPPPRRPAAVAQVIRAENRAERQLDAPPPDDDDDDGDGFPPLPKRRGRPLRPRRT